MNCTKCGAEVKFEYNHCPCCGEALQIVPDYSIYDDDDINIIIEGTKDVESKKNKAAVSKKKEQQRENDRKAQQEARELKKKKIFMAFATIFLLIVVLIITINLVIAHEHNNSYSYQMKQGKASMMKNDTENAERYYLKALSISPDDISVRLSLAELYLEEEDTQKAVSYLEEIIDDKITSENEAKVLQAYKMLIRIYESEGKSEEILFLKDNVENSQILKLFTDYDVNVPKLNLKGGTYEKELQLSMSCSKDLEIYYTTDGSDPTVNGTLYQGSVELKEAGMHTIKAVSKNKIGIYSDIVTETYVIKYAAPTDPVVTPNGGKFQSETYVYISVPEGCTAYYTWDRTDPDLQSDVYTSPILIPEGYNMLSVIIIDNKTGLKSAIYRGMFECTVE